MADVYPQSNSLFGIFPDLTYNSGNSISPSSKNPNMDSLGPKSQRREPLSPKTNNTNTGMSPHSKAGISSYSKNCSTVDTPTNNGENNESYYDNVYPANHPQPYRNPPFSPRAVDRVAYGKEAVQQDSVAQIPHISIERGISVDSDKRDECLCM